MKDPVARAACLALLLMHMSDRDADKKAWNLSAIEAVGALVWATVAVKNYLTEPEPKS